MSVFIESIKPINWFNYKGEDNLIRFSRGTNVMVGNNNAGKTKLYNAFRYIIDDTVILKVKDRSQTVSKSESIHTSENLIELINQSALNEIKVNENLKIGVELIFSKKRRDEEKKYLLRKISNIRKVSDNKIEIINREKKVFLIDKYTKRERLISDDFESIVSLLLPNRYKKFFLIEGEQIGMMTPLFGDGLKSTIKGLTDIDDIDSIVDLVDDLQKKVINEKRNYEKTSESLSKEQQKKLEERNDYLEQNEKLDEILQKKKTEFDNLETEIGKSETQAKESDKRNQLLETLNKYERTVSSYEEEINKNDRVFLDSLTNQDDFLISRLDKFDDIDESFNSIDKRFAGYVLDRRNELNTKISNEDQLLVSELNLSQPHPDILEKMLKHEPKPKCFVCKSDLETENQNFIKNVLIPHFRNDEEKQDDLIDNIELLKDSFKRIFQISRGYSKNNDEWLNNYFENKGKLISSKNNAEKNLKEFIKNNGDRADLDKGDALFILDYGKLKVELEKCRTSISSIEEEIKSNKERIININKIIDNDNEETDPKLQGLIELDRFVNDIDAFLHQLKSDVYYDFREKLEKKSSNRFKQLMRNNKTIEGQELKVNLEESNIGSKVDFNFEVYPIDNRGNKLTQTGGASSTCEPLAVVFALIDISESRVSYPFIADAPVSPFTIDTKYSFFETLVEEEVFEQSIIISMDCWDNVSQDINSLGVDIKNLIKDKKGSSFILMKPKPNNTGVEFNYIIDGT